MSDVERRPWPRDPRYLVGDDGTIIGPKGHELRGGKLPRGYRFVGVGGSRSEYVHVMVCETFHGPRPAGKQAAHENGKVADCAATNLSWKTPVDNAADKVRHGTYTQGEDHAPAKLTEREVREIRRRAATGESQYGLGRAYGVTQSNVQRIVARISWTHLSPAPDEDMTHAPLAPSGRRGESNGAAKLTADAVREIRSAYATGELQREIGARYGITQTTVGKIVRRARWAHVA